MGTQKSIIGELEDAIKSGSQEHRVDTLKRVTDLFMSGADRSSNAHQGSVEGA
jgi:hypothetical protein